VASSHSVGSRPAIVSKPKARAPCTRFASSRAKLSRGFVRPPSWIAISRSGWSSGPPAKRGALSASRDRVSSVRFIPILPCAEGREGRRGLAPGEPGFDVEHPDDADADEGGAEVDEGQPRRAATEKIDIIGRPSTKDDWKKMYPRWCSGWFIEMRVSKAPFSGSSTRTVLSKVEAMREPG